MNHLHILKAYKTALQLYPKKFRGAYAEQMLLTAEDALQEVQTRRTVAIVAGRLIVDLLVTIVKENSKQIGTTIMKHVKVVRQKKKRLITLQVFQLIGMGAATYVWLAFAFFNFNALRHVNAENFFGGTVWTWSAELITTLALLSFVPLTFAVIHKTTKFSLWRKITWSYGLGLLASACYTLIAYLANTISIYATSLQHDYEWLLSLLCLGCYYIMLHKLLEWAGASNRQGQKA